MSPVVLVAVHVEGRAGEAPLDVTWACKATPAWHLSEPSGIQRLPSTSHRHRWDGPLVEGLIGLLPGFRPGSYTGATCRTRSKPGAAGGRAGIEEAEEVNSWTTRLCLSRLSAAGPRRN